MRQQRPHGRTARDDHGATAIEYALMIGLIALVIVAAVSLFGSSLASNFGSTANAMGALNPDSSAAMDAAALGMSASPSPTSAAPTTAPPTTAAPTTAAPTTAAPTTAAPTTAAPTTAAPTTAAPTTAAPTTAAPTTAAPTTAAPAPAAPAPVVTPSPYKAGGSDNFKCDPSSAWTAKRVNGTWTCVPRKSD